MTTSLARQENIATNVYFDESSVHFELADGRAIAAPLAWFPRLLRATAEQRRNWEFIGRGAGVHWPDVDEDISIRGLLGLGD